MERIKEALERARKERESSGAPEPASKPVINNGSSHTGQPGTLDFDYTRTRIVSPDPAVMRDKRVVGHSNSGDAVTDAYRMLRTRILRAMDEHSWKSLAVTSPGPGEGKSLTAVNLALSMAREVNRTVLLVDLDLRRPSVHEFFGIEVDHGISEYLTQDAELEDILINPSVQRCVILPGSGRVQNSSEMLVAPRMQALAEELAHRYPERIVIFDLPPVLAVDDALAFSPFVDAFLLVVEESKTQAEEIMAAHDALSQSNVVGTVLNKSRETRGHYYY